MIPRDSQTPSAAFQTESAGRISGAVSRGYRAGVTPTRGGLGYCVGLHPRRITLWRHPTITVASLDPCCLLALRRAGSTAARYAHGSGRAQREFDHGCDGDALVTGDCLWCRQQGEIVKGPDCASTCPT